MKVHLQYTILYKGIDIDAFQSYKYVVTDTKINFV